MLRRAWRTRCVALRRARGERIASPGSLVYHTRPRGLLRAEGVAVLIAANWKMHGDRAFLAAYFEGAAALSWPTAQTHLVFPPATLLERAAEAAARAGLVPWSPGDPRCSGRGSYGLPVCRAGGRGRGALGPPWALRAPRPGRNGFGRGTPSRRRRLGRGCAAWCAWGKG